MSNTGDDRPDREALKGLDAAVGRLIGEVTALRGRAAEAEAKSEEFGELVQRFTGNEGEAGRLLSRLEALESENADLKERLERGRDGVDRLLAKIKFLEEQR